MASAQTTRGGVTYYTVNLSTSVSNVNDTTARIYWTATVDFGDWYYYGVRLHVKVGGVWRASGDGYTTSSWKRAVTVSGYTDAERKDNDYDVWVEAYTESVAVNGYGGVGATTSCGEGARIGKVPAYEPAARPTSGSRARPTGQPSSSGSTTRTTMLGSTTTASTSTAIPTAATPRTPTTASRSPTGATRRHRQTITTTTT